MFVVATSANGRKNQEGIVSNSIVYFTNEVPVSRVVTPEALKLKRIVDMVGDRVLQKLLNILCAYFLLSNLLLIIYILLSTTSNAFHFE